MSINNLVSYLIIWSMLGVILFNFVVIYLLRSGDVYESRGKDGLRKRDSSVKGWITTLGFLGLVVAFLLAGNYFSFLRIHSGFTFWQIFWLNFALMMILVVYDSIVIDWLVIAKWRPAFLKIPDEMNAESMKKHILFTIPVAPVICAVIAAISAGASLLLWIG